MAVLHKSRKWSIDAHRAMDQVWAQELFEAWLTRFCAEDIGPVQTSVDQAGVRLVMVGEPPGSQFTLRVRGLEVTLDSQGDISDNRLVEVLRATLECVASGMPGEMLVYQSKLTLSGANIEEPLDSTHFLRVLGDQIHLEGYYRISDLSVVHFQEGLFDNVPEEGLLLAPPSSGEALLFVTSPIPGALSQRKASTAVDVVAAACALASGRPVAYKPPRLLLDAEAVAAALGKQYDASILGLARDSVSLDFTADMYWLGGPEAMSRAEGALLTYHAALSQTNPDVAVMLFVTSIEALVSPRASWGRDKVTARFIASMRELCPSAIETLLQHQNVEQAFGDVGKGSINSQSKRLLENIYSARSLPTHSGLAPAQSDFQGITTAGSFRVALLSELSRAAILQYLRRPRCWLIGHPRYQSGEITAADTVEDVRRLCQLLPLSSQMFDRE